VSVLRVGLTGGVASGKSTVARLLADRGAAVRDADALVEQLYAPGRAGSEAVARVFGEAMLRADGSVDRRALGDVVLADAQARARLEACVHPLVHDAIARWLVRLGGLDPRPAVAVVEAALLVETGAYRDYDRLIVVSAPTVVRRRRALLAGWRTATLDGVLAAQLGDAEREQVADYVLANGGDLMALEFAVDDVWRLLLEDADAVARGAALPPRLRPAKPAQAGPPGRAHGNRGK